MKKWLIIIISILIGFGILFGVISSINKTKNEIIEDPVFEECKEIIISQNEKLDKYFLEEKTENRSQKIGTLKEEDVFVFFENNLLDILKNNNLLYSVSALEEEINNKGFFVIRNYVGYTESNLEKKNNVSKHSSFKRVTLEELKGEYDISNLRLYNSNSVEPIYIVASNITEDNQEKNVLYELIKIDREDASYKISNVNLLNFDLNTNHLKRISENMIKDYDNSFIK